MSEKCDHLCTNLSYGFCILELGHKGTITVRGIDSTLFEEIRVYAVRHNSKVGPVLNDAMKQFITGEDSQ